MDAEVTCVVTQTYTLARVSVGRGNSCHENERVLPYNLQISRVISVAAVMVVCVHTCINDTQKREYKGGLRHKMSE